MVERRVTHSEIVDRKSHTEVAQITHRRQCFIGVDHVRFGELDHKATRVCE